MKKVILLILLIFSYSEAFGFIGFGGGKITVEEDGGSTYEDITKITYSGTVTQSEAGTVEMSGTTTGSSEFITNNNVRIYHDGTDWVSEDSVNLGSNNLTTTGTVTADVTGDLTGNADTATTAESLLDSTETVGWDSGNDEWDISDDVNISGTLTVNAVEVSGGGGTSYIGIADNDAVILQQTEGSDVLVIAPDTTASGVVNDVMIMELADVGHENRQHFNLSNGGGDSEDPTLTIFPASTATKDRLAFWWEDSADFEGGSGNNNFGTAIMRAYGGSIGLWTNTAQVTFLDGATVAGVARGYWVINSERKQWEFTGIDGVSHTFVFGSSLWNDLEVAFDDPTIIVFASAGEDTEYIAINYHDVDDRPKIYSGKGTPFELVDNDTEYWTHSEPIVVADNDTGDLNVIGKQIDSRQITIPSPEDFTNEIIMFRVDSTEFPQGIVLTSITLSKNDNTSTADINIEKWDDMAGTGATTIVNFSNFDEYERTLTTLSANTIDAGDIILVDATAMTDNIDQLHVKFEYVEPAD